MCGQPTVLYPTGLQALGPSAWTLQALSARGRALPRGWQMWALLAVLGALNVAILTVHSSVLAACGRLGGLNPGEPLAVASYVKRLSNAAGAAHDYVHFIKDLLLAWRAGPAPLELVWADEFDGPGIDTASWSFMLGNGSQYGLPGAHCSLSAISKTCCRVGHCDRHFCS